MKSVEGHIHGWLVEHSISLLRISLGLVFLVFGLLKYFPGVSPADNLSLVATHMLTFGFVGNVVPYSVGLILIATLECAIGLALLTGIWTRLVVSYLPSNSSASRRC